MKRFIEGEDRRQVTMLPECLDDYIGEDNQVQVVDVFVEALDLRGLGFAEDDEYRCPAGELAIHRFRPLEKGLNIDVYWPSHCPHCRIKEECTTSSCRRIRRWEYEDVLERVQQRLDRKLDAMTLRRPTAEHVFATLKHWMGSTHFLTRTLVHVGTEMSLHVLAYNLKRVMRRLGVGGLMAAMKAMKA